MQRSSFIAVLAAAAAPSPRAAAPIASEAVWHVAIFRFGASDIAKAVDGFRTMRSASRRHAGNLGYDVYRSPEDDGAFFILERWASSAALKAHEQTDVFAKVGRGVLVRYAELHDTVTGVALPES